MSDVAPGASGPVLRAAEDQAINRVIEALRGRFSAVPAEVVSERVRRVHQQYAGAPVREFVPVLVERQVRAELAAKVVAA